MPTMMKMPKAAEMAGIPYGCLRRWILEGRFKGYVKSGNSYIINMDRLVEFLECRDSNGGVQNEA